MAFAASLTQTDGLDIFTKECRRFHVIPAKSKFTKAEGFGYSGPDHFTWHSVTRVSEQGACQATFSHIPGSRSSLSFAHDFGGKLYSAIDRKLHLCIATVYHPMKIEILCGSESASDKVFSEWFPKFSKAGVKLRFKTAAEAANFHALFQRYQTFA